MYDKSMETLKYLHEMTGLEEYMKQWILPHYKIKTIETAMKLCIRCQKTYKLIDEWLKFVTLIDERNKLSESIILAMTARGYSKSKVEIQQDAKKLESFVWRFKDYIKQAL